MDNSLAPACVAFWHGSSLGPIERACIRSLLRHDHQVALYCYREPAGVPAGVEIRDAAAILPESCLFFHRGGSPAPFSDWFRYALQREGCGTWVDLDLYFVAPLDGEREYLFGLQEPDVINNAVLRLPSASRLVTELLAIFERDNPLPWLSVRERTADWWTRRLSPGTRRAQLPWGATGPRALSALARSEGLAGKALTTETFYPVPWQRAEWIANPRITLEEVIQPATVAVHLWNEQIGALKARAAPAGSFLARLIAEGYA